VALACLGNKVEATSVNPLPVYKTACVSHGIRQDYFGDGGVHGHPFSQIIVEEVREVAGGRVGPGGDKVHLGSTTLSQGSDQSQVGRNICCVFSEQQD